MDAYNQSAVIISKPPCEESISNAEKSTLICSTLERSKHSAKLLGAGEFESYQLFNEAELPVINIPLVEFTPPIWSIIFRVFWFIGISKGVESKKEISVRVDAASEMLEDLAKKHNNILLVGHGIMNRLIAKRLLENDWNREQAPDGKKHYGFRYWEYSKFTK